LRRCPSRFEQALPLLPDCPLSDPFTDRLHRLFVQIQRITKINELTAITDDVVEAARNTLVIGVT
jgi:hypothetical protein